MFSMSSLFGQGYCINRTLSDTDYDQTGLLHLRYYFSLGVFVVIGYEYMGEQWKVASQLGSSLNSDIFSDWMEGFYSLETRRQLQESTS